MLERILKLISIIHNLLLAEENPYSINFTSICEQSLGDEAIFGIYTEISKGFILTARSKENNKLLKDIIKEEEITKTPKMFYNTYYFDLLVFSRKYQRKILIRVGFNSSRLSGKEEEKNIENILQLFYSFHELYDKNYVLLELIQILKETAEVEDIEEIIEKTTRVTKKLLGTQASSVLLRDEKTEELYFRVVDSDKSDKIKEIRIPINKGIAGYTARTGRPLIVNDVSVHPEFYSSVDEKSGFVTKSIISAPIRPFNKIIGVIEAVNKVKETKFTENDLQILETIGNILGVNLISSILYQKLNRVSTNIIKSLITALEARDEYTKGHSLRVQTYSVKIARNLKLPNKKIRQVELSSILHDIGKIGIPDTILRKPSMLTDEEYDLIKKHPIIGYNILSSIEGLEEILDGIKYHHERFDGKGYPEGLKGKDIPLIARIIAVADTFDAITSDRPYRKGLPTEYALEEIKKVKGTQLDPEIVDTFLTSFSNTEESLPRV